MGVAAITSMPLDGCTTSVVHRASDRLIFRRGEGHVGFDYVFRGFCPLRPISSAVISLRISNMPGRDICGRSGDHNDASMVYNVSGSSCIPSLDASTR